MIIRKILRGGRLIGSSCWPGACWCKRRGVDGYSGGSRILIGMDGRMELGIRNTDFSKVSSLLKMNVKVDRYEDCFLRVSG